MVKPAVHTEGIWKRWRHGNNVISLTEFSPNTNPKMTGDCWVLKFLQRSVDEKQLMRFQSESFVFKFFQRSVGVASHGQARLTL